VTQRMSHKLGCGLLDLPLIDCDGKCCGIVDDIELRGGPGEPLRVEALLVGPGAYSGRLPRWAMAFARLLAGDHIARIPWSEVRQVSSAVHLNVPAGRHRLQRSENQARRWIPRKGAM
jgi:sporulation protein YlmC with PRC-barrel domain